MNVFNLEDIEEYLIEQADTSLQTWIRARFAELRLREKSVQQGQADFTD